MSSEQINRLAEEYANSKMPNRNTYDDDDLWGSYKCDAKLVLEWLLRDYLIVERNEVLEAYNNAVSDCLSNDFQVVQAGYAYKDVIETLFSELLNSTER